jgi:hypothetical protein
MDMKTIYVIDYNVLIETKDSLFFNLYEKIPLCFKNKQFISIEVESIPKEQEILLLRKNGSLMSMDVFKVVYYEWKIFVIVNNAKGYLRPMEAEYEKMNSNGAVPQLDDGIAGITG